MPQANRKSAIQRGMQARRILIWQLRRSVEEHVGAGIDATGILTRLAMLRVGGHSQPALYGYLEADMVRRGNNQGLSLLKPARVSGARLHGVALLDSSLNLR